MVFFIDFVLRPSTLDNLTKEDSQNTCFVYLSVNKQSARTHMDRLIAWQEKTRTAQTANHTNDKKKIGRQELKI